MQTGVGIEKLHLPPKSQNFLGIQDGKKTGKAVCRASQSAILLWSISLTGVFQHPQAIAQVSPRKTSLTQGKWRYRDSSTLTLCNLWLSGIQTLDTVTDNRGIRGSSNVPTLPADVATV